MIETLGPPVVKLAMSCGACPSQWDGELADGTILYVRFRHGRLTMGFGPNEGAAVDDSFGKIIWTDPWDPQYEGDRGIMDLDEMLLLTGLRLAPDCDVSRASQEGFWGPGGVLDQMAE